MPYGYYILLWLKATTALNLCSDNIKLWRERSKIPQDISLVCTWSIIPWDWVGWWWFLGGVHVPLRSFPRYDHDLRCDATCETITISHSRSSKVIYMYIYIYICVWVWVCVCVCVYVCVYICMYMYYFTVNILNFVIFTFYKIFYNTSVKIYIFIFFISFNK